MNMDKIIDDIAEISGYIWQKGWAERNAGNISTDVSRWADTFETTPVEFPLNKTYKRLSGKYFLITATGSRMRNIHKNPLENILVIKITDKGNGYKKVIFNEINPATLEPTSELPTHLAIHNMLNEKGENRNTVLHAHVTELIALTHIKEFCDEERLNFLLWSMHPEAAMFVSGGTGFVPYAEPGSEAIAQKTVEALHNHKVAIWEKHGVFAVGETVSDAFDTIDILAKAAKIFFTVKNAGYLPEGINSGRSKP